MLWLSKENRLEVRGYYLVLTLRNLPSIFRRVSDIKILTFCLPTIPSMNKPELQTYYNSCIERNAHPDRQVGICCLKSRINFIRRIVQD